MVELQARIDENCPHEKIVTLSKEGCGFVGKEENHKLYLSKEELSQEAKKRVFSTFKLEGIGTDEINIQGNLIYMQEVPLNGKKVYFYGVQFIDAHQALIEPILQHVAGLADQGKVKLAS